MAADMIQCSSHQGPIGPDFEAVLLQDACILQMTTPTADPQWQFKTKTILRAHLPQHLSTIFQLLPFLSLCKTTKHIDSPFKVEIFYAS